MPSFVEMGSSPQGASDYPMEQHVSGIASEMIKEPSVSTFLISSLSPRIPSAIPQRCLQATLLRSPLLPQILLLRLGMDMIRSIRSTLDSYIILETDHVTGCHQWNPDQSRLYQDLSTDQGLEYPRHHSKLLFRTEDFHVLETP